MLFRSPVLLSLAPSTMPDMAQMDHAQHAAHMRMAGASAGLPSASLAAVGLHTAAMFLVMAVVAVVVYEKVGLAILRRAWLNLDLLWAAALVAAGALTLIVR